MSSLRFEAEKLRDMGYSYNMITEKLGVSQSTMSYWFRDRPFKPNKEVLERIKYGPVKSGAARHNARVEQTKEIRKKAVAELGPITPRDLLMAGIGIYIGEGSKSIESVRIMNSDPFVIAFCMRWFRESCKLEDTNIIASLFLYPDNDAEKALEYWQNITKLLPENFRKTHVDVRENKRKQAKGKLPYGTVQLRINANGDPNNGVMLFRRIRGWMDAILGEV